MKRTLIPILAVVAVLTAMLSCDHKQQVTKDHTQADSIIIATYKTKDYQRVIELCDSFEQTGDITPVKAAYFRGSIYYSLSNYQSIREEFQRLLGMTPTTRKDNYYYYKGLTKFVISLGDQLDYEGVLRIAPPLIESLKTTDLPNSKKLYFLQQFMLEVGMSQFALGMKEEAAKSFEMCYGYAQELVSVGDGYYSLYSAVVNMSNIFSCYMNVKDYTAAEKWSHRQDSITTITLEQYDTPDDAQDHVLALKYYNQACLALKQDRPKEAASYFASYKGTQAAKHIDERLNIAEFLLAAGRYTEAADAFSVVDQYFIESAMDFSLDNVGILNSKFQANYKAGRRDSALAVAAYVFENLDSAIMKQKNSDAAELATVYETHKKDAEIARQQIELSRQQWLGTLVALVLLTAFFIIYTLYRRRAQKRLAVAHENLEMAHTELKTAYDQLEETTTAKERIESELRIARDIQMSMVPGVFPEYEGLDMFASMTPAKEVGGDLYGYVMQGDNLYFCVGDVSGKGVPASLFMAQSARLFRTLAAEGMMPADIAVRMNNELVEGNDKGMFVTMFIGLLHLDSGRLNYCNCGHNPPVLDGEFMDVAYANLPLGLLESNPFEGETIADIRGKRLLIYTDGLNEAENAQQELLGNARLLELMADAQSLDSHQVIDMLKEAVEKHRNGAEPNDDLTLMCITLN